MNRMVRMVSVGCSMIVVLTVVPIAAQSADDAVRHHADQSFQEMNQPERSSKPKTPYPSDQYLIGNGQGDLTKGKNVCQRVSELSARTDLAKQIRVMVKEHMVDRVRDRAGQETEQDIELTREEIVQEYLQGVKIVERQVDEDNKTCSATAVMLKSQIQPKPAPDHIEPTPTVIR